MEDHGLVTEEDLDLCEDCEEDPCICDELEDVDEILGTES